MFKTIMLLCGLVFLHISGYSLVFITDLRLSSCHFFISVYCNTLTFNSNLLLVETERAMMRCADEVVLLADHTKVGRPALAFLCEWSEIDLLVIDRKLEDRKKSMLAQTGARLLIAGDLEEFGR
jgi:DeoR/GlpR family transcriptional regulator of sugar metabolism